MHDVKSYYLKSNNLNTEEQPAIVPKKGSKDSLADGEPDGFYVKVTRTNLSDHEFMRSRIYAKKKYTIPGFKSKSVSAIRNGVASSRIPDL